MATEEEKEFLNKLTSFVTNHFSCSITAGYYEIKLRNMDNFIPDFCPTHLTVTLPLDVTSAPSVNMK